MEAEATVETMMSTIHAHPTLYEAMGEAFNNVYGWPSMCDLICVDCEPRGLLKGQDAHL